MAGFNTPQNAQTPSSQQPKQMSSRLLNMKFMQRAAAASPATSTPGSSTAQTPASEPLAKRRRTENTTASPLISTPGTPINRTINSGLATPTTAQSTSLGFAAREGTSTFSRFEGADTEWVLDVKMPFSEDKEPGSSKKHNLNSKLNGANGSTSRFSALAKRDEESEDGSGKEDDIWNTSQPSGRQTFGSFKKKRKSRTTTQEDQHQEGDDQDLSSASISDQNSQPDENSNSDSSSDSYAARHRKTPTSQRRGQARPANEVNSDEEMRQVRQAIEQKHRSMMAAKGGATPTGLVAPEAKYNAKGKRGKKRKGREEGSYKKKKKARKTI